MRRIGIVLAVVALTGCGSGAAASSHTGSSHATGGISLPNEIVEYTIADTPAGASMGPETVWWDPATGQGRDRQGLRRGSGRASGN